MGIWAMGADMDGTVVLTPKKVGKKKKIERGASNPPTTSTGFLQLAAQVEYVNGALSPFGSSAMSSFGPD